MGVISGVGGAVDGVACVRSWSITSKADLKAYACSASDGGTGRIDGNIDWSGSYDAYGATPLKMPGETFDFEGDMGNSKGALGNVMVDSSEITWDIEGGEVIQHTVNFSSNGTLTFGATTATDTTVPDPEPSVGTKVSCIPVGDAYSAGTHDQTDVRNMTLTFTANNASYASSGTAGVIKRVAGNIDWTLAFERYTDDLSTLIDPNTVNEIRVWTNATEYWEMLWGMFSDISNVEVSMEDATPISAQQNVGMQGFTDVAATPTKGSIKKPDTTTWWP